MASSLLVSTLARAGGGSNQPSQLQQRNGSDQPSIRSTLGFGLNGFGFRLRSTMRMRNKKSTKQVNRSGFRVDGGWTVREKKKKKKKSVSPFWALSKKVNKTGQTVREEKKKSVSPFWALSVELSLEKAKALTGVLKELYCANVIGSTTDSNRNLAGNVHMCATTERISADAKSWLGMASVAAGKKKGAAWKTSTARGRRGRKS
ncbi:uncharacterized protein LOC115962003 [Quercus lobata]|uniref:uncharacterized protein LOC115962003 n=1 Tax=Quercus lobata TaxID=97700 RepID=UPI001244D3B8|nr:uncharacterized protein LOC115962003 [Quercus lobata]